MVDEGGYVSEACTSLAFEHDCAVDATKGKYSGEYGLKEGNFFWCATHAAENGKCVWGDPRSTAPCKTCPHARCPPGVSMFAQCAG